MVGGFGLGLRPEHYRDVADGSPAVDWLEVVTENYLVPGGKPLDWLDRLRRRYPMVMHGVSLSIAGSDPLDDEYLIAVKRLAERVHPAWISDHLCWTGIGGHNLHDLLPIPFTEEALARVSDRVDRVQHLLGRALVIENVSAYLRFERDDMREWDFLGALAVRTGCGLLLDLNNVYVNSVNHSFDPREFVDSIPARSVRQIHLAGHSREGDRLIDTHDAPVCEAVWDLYERAIRRLGPVPTMIERDDRIPPLGELLEELDIARSRAARALRAETGNALAA